MLSADQKKFFDVFGYVVMGVLNEADRAALEMETQNALRDANSDRFSGEANCFLPMMSSHTPVSRGLATSEKLVSVASALLEERRPIVKPPKGVSYRRKTYWHNDTTSSVPVRFLKMVTYLGGGGIEVVPGSHRTAIDAYLRDILGSRIEVEESEAIFTEHRVPTHRVELSPGEFVAFDVNLWHANHDGKDRLQWTVSFMSYPETDADRETTVEHLGQFFDQNPSAAYDQKVYRYFPEDWEDGTSREPLARHLVDSGVMENFLTRYGHDR